ncbi:PilW family protein [Nitrosococcus watsonii]|uniref:Type IV pilus assembly protein PilW n=1 Tax=Nitrosococcus watsoni (strain C-113) TaxID=105559 RepID=D8K7R0_NITWC|nr:PilW family protein [Nitrosococcus watsonii]ADJ28937.1 type IV pilus assembly protein PilW [Nitrosococcus watsonii C-113]
MKLKPHSPLPTQQRGFSLTEILVGMTAGLLLTAGVIQVFVSSKQGYRIQEALSRLQENGRFAMEFISQDARNTGFLGCGGSTSRFANRLNNSNQYAWNFSAAVEGFEATGAGTWTPTLDATVTSALSNRDVLTLRHSLGNPTRVINHSASSAPIQVNTVKGLSQFDIAMVSDCIDIAIFEITNDPTVANTLEYSTGSGTPGNATDDLEKKYTDQANVAQITTSTYYIRTNPEGIPSLYRKRGVDPSQELIEGVEDMQILYGEDTDGNQEANSYVTADNVANWNNVINLRISLLLQTLENNLASSPQSYTFNGATTTPTDRRLRRVFTTTLNLRNRTL